MKWTQLYRRLFSGLLVTWLLAASLQASEPVGAAAVLGVTPNKDAVVLRLAQQQGVAGFVADDSYSLAPVVQDEAFAHWMSAVGAPTTHTYDGIEESGGANLYGSDGGSFALFEGLVSLGAEADRIIV